ncbi:MAG TPA: hypothetical protein VHD56_06575 [Tepidisphaeraceae bacterium]|nr:hypothetical protein [Tepidisphaeraceae bacterium]
MSRSFRDWLSEGEAIYAEAIKEYQSLEAQIQQLEARLVEKKSEVNQIAQLIGKPSVEGPRRVSAQIIEEDEAPPGVAVGAVTRALTGRNVR